MRFLTLLAKITDLNQMLDISYRLYLDGTSFTREQLDRVETIVVSQEMDLLWEAEISTHTVLDEQGHWKYGDGEEFPEMKRIRLELTLDGFTWTPLIEGPIAKVAHQFSSQPGASEVKLTVRDDSVFLNRNQEAHTYAHKTEREIISTVLSEYEREQDANARFAPEVASIPGDQPRNAARRQTAMQFLRAQAHQRGWHAYVLPARERGQPSRFCYKPKARAVTSLPALQLIGDDRTLNGFHVEANPEGPQHTSGARIDFAEGRLAATTMSSTAQQLMAEQPAAKRPAQRLADPRNGAGLQPDVIAEADTAMAMYAFRATGRVVPFRYNAVLTPYEVVSVRAGKVAASADYLIRKVTHTLTRNLYTQEFEAVSDSINQVGPAKPTPKIT